MLRSVLAVIAGYVSLSLLVMTSFALIMVIMPQAFPKPGAAPADSLLILILTLGFAFAVIGGYLTAILADRSHFKHVLFLAAVVLGFGIVKIAVEYGIFPMWYLLTQLASGIGGVLAGGKMRLAIKPVLSKQV
jgi:MFS family permease